MSHPNAALTPRHQLIVARLVVEHGWPISEAVVAVGLLALDLRGIALILLVVALQVVAEPSVVRNYGLAMVCITPLALLMGQIAARRPAGTLVADRTLETIIGAVVGVAVVLVSTRAPRDQAGS